MTTEVKLYKLAQELADALKDVLIIQVGPNHYDLYNCYSVQLASNNWLVERYHDRVDHNFYSLKTAAIWCTYDHRKRWTEADHLLELDRQLGASSSAVLLYQRLLKRGNGPVEVYSAKLTQERAIQTHSQLKIDGYIGAARDWQRQKFNNKARQFN